MFNFREYNPAFKYAHVVKTMYMAAFYGTLIPIAYFLVALSLSL
jgi:hypothetical protein